MEKRKKGKKKLFRNSLFTLVPDAKSFVIEKKKTQNTADFLPNSAVKAVISAICTE